MLCKFKTAFTLEHYGIIHISCPHRPQTKCELHSKVAVGSLGWYTCMHRYGIYTAQPFRRWYVPQPLTVLKFSSEYLILFSQKILVGRHYTHSFPQTREHAEWETWEADVDDSTQHTQAAQDWISPSLIRDSLNWGNSFRFWINQR